MTSTWRGVRRPSGKGGQWPLVPYVSDIRTAMTQAKEAAGDKNVLVYGAGYAPWMSHKKEYLSVINEFLDINRKGQGA